MKKTITVAVLLLCGLAVEDHLSNAFAQSSRLEELQDENSELRDKLDHIQQLVTEAKSDLDDVESDVQSDESCEDTNAYSNAGDVEAKLNEIEAEASH